MTGPKYPSAIAAPAEAVCPSSSLMKRVGQVLQDMTAARTVSDDEIHQHARDCTFLMESAYDRFQAYGDIHAREEAYVWMNRRDEALRSLSPEWKAAREAEILREAEAGAGFFLDQADRDRQAMAGRAA